MRSHTLNTGRFPWGPQSQRSHTAGGENNHSSRSTPSLHTHTGARTHTCTYTHTHTHLTFQIGSCRAALRADVLLKSDTPCRHSTCNTHKHSTQGSLQHMCTCTCAYTQTRTRGTYRPFIICWPHTGVCRSQVYKRKGVFMCWTCETLARSSQT